MVVTNDDYNQYFIAIEQEMCMESTDVATAVFNLIASHYVFNLSYHDKIHEMLRFVQEKWMDIQSNEKGSLNPLSLYPISTESQVCLIP